MTKRRMTSHALLRTGLWLTGLTVSLMPGGTAWSQQPDPSAAKSPRAESRLEQGQPTPEGRAADLEARKPSLDEQRAVRAWLEAQARTSARGSQRHPLHEKDVAEARAEVDLLEAQIEAKKAHIRLVEARLKQAKGRQELLNKQAGKGSVDEEKKTEIDGTVTVLEAECDAERAEVKEPLVLLKYAKRRLEHIESMDSRPEGGPPGGMGPMGMPHSGWNGHPGMHPFGGPHPWMHSFESSRMGVDRMVDVDDRLLQLRDAIEDLEYEVERLGGRPRR